MRLFATYTGRRKVESVVCVSDRPTIVGSVGRTFPTQKITALRAAAEGRSVRRSDVSDSKKSPRCARRRVGRSDVAGSFLSALCAAWDRSVGLAPIFSHDGERYRAPLAQSVLRGPGERRARNGNRPRVRTCTTLSGSGLDHRTRCMTPTWCSDRGQPSDRPTGIAHRLRVLKPLRGALFGPAHRDTGTSSFWRSGNRVPWLAKH